MSFKSKILVLSLSGVFAIYAMIGGLPAIGGLLTSSAQQTVNDPNAQLKILEEVLGHIQNDYVDVPDFEKVRQGGLKGIADGLDPFSAYLNADLARELSDKKTASLVGIGAEYSQVAGYLYVIAVTKGSNADKAGIRSGDYFEYVDGKATRDISLYEAKRLVSGEAGTTVTLRVLRSGEKPRTVKVTRGAAKIPSPEVRIENDKAAVIKLFGIDESTTSELRTVITNVTRQGAQRMVLDLRGVSTGTLEQGAAVANLFIRDGNLATLIGKENKPLRSFAADAAKTIFDGPVVLVTDLSTSGASEVVAAAFKERKRGEIVGERTFGMGTDQTFFPHSSGGGYLLTVARWASPSGTPFFGEDRNSMGVKPTVEVKRPDSIEPIESDSLLDQDPNDQPKPGATPKTASPAAQEDVQMKKALELVAAAAKAA
ncbi:MAG: PDZ domain-containing protein [Acidobacteria bacterium]|nr:PDZ domain-containing protein [Acidobacteriota bacterium]MCW5950536.1 PDZ domain-containing protein [Pyrinomonadaceae bacterium]